MPLGIPSFKNLGSLSKIKPGDVHDFIIQKHKAQRAGTHFDVRFGSPSTGLYSWATKKELPQPGKPITLFQQPIHSFKYKDFEGVIPKGYGAGSVEKYKEDKVLINAVTPDAIHLTLSSKQQPERYALLKPKDGSKDWLLSKANPPDKADAEKIKFKLVEKDDALKLLKGLPEGSSVQAKVDGALNFIKLLKDRAEVLSYRTSKRTGGPILHTERFFGQVPRLDIPKHLRGSILLSEVYGVRKGKAIQGQELGGILNSGVAKSLERQKEKGIELKAQVFDIARYSNTKVQQNLPYKEKKKMMLEIINKLPFKKKFHLPDEANTKETSQALLKKIQQNKHPLTSEGIIIRTPDGKRMKYKTTEEHDVYIRELFGGEGKYTDKGVGGFWYSWTPKGAVVGKVGTGLSDELRKDMYETPSRFIGRKARVRGHEKYPSGALRAPALISLHEG